jgi:hypothetical protein
MVVFNLCFVVFVCVCVFCNMYCTYIFRVLFVYLPLLIYSYFVVLCYIVLCYFYFCLY